MRKIVNTLTLSVLLGSFVAVVSCSKHDPAPTKTTTPVVTQDVYVGGTLYPSGAVGSAKIVYWKNDTLHNIPFPSDLPGAQYFGAQSMFVQGKDVYILGYVRCSDSTYYSYWKNDTRVTLPYGFAPECIFVEGTDIYIGGSNWSGGLAQYLKNGTFVSLPGNYGRIVSMTVAGGIVYAAGTVAVDSSVFIVSQATVWAGGVPSSLGGTSSIANSIAVSGNDVYVSGWSQPTDLQRSFYWKNGIQTRLYGPYATSNTMANGIIVAGNDTYISGNNSTGVYWKNGVATALYDDPSSPDFPFAAAIAVSGEDVYVAGTVGAQPHPIYWKNGVRVPLGTTLGATVGIFVH